MPDVTVSFSLNTTFPKDCSVWQAWGVSTHTRSKIHNTHTHTAKLTASNPSKPSSLPPGATPNSSFDLLRDYLPEWPGTRALCDMSWPPCCLFSIYKTLFLMTWTETEQQPSVRALKCQICIGVKRRRNWSAQFFRHGMTVVTDR